MGKQWEIRKRIRQRYPQSSPVRSRVHEFGGDVAQYIYGNMTSRWLDHHTSWHKADSISGQFQNVLERHP